jgi:hypothetical protein
LGSEPSQQHNGANVDQSHYFPETNTFLRKVRTRPSDGQAAELRELFKKTSHPTKEQREQLADRIGMYVSPIIRLLRQ